MAWRFVQLAPEGKQPPARHMHGSAVIDGSLYVMGGQSKLDVLQDVWTLPLADPNPAWRRIKLNEAKKMLKMRVFHATVGYGKRLYMSGGTNHQNLSEVFNDLLAFDTEEETLTRVETDIDEGEPPMLCRHSLVAMGGSLWAQGGWDGVAWLDTMWRLDLYALPRPKWSLLDAEGFTPWRRSHCCLVPSPTSANTLLLFGGGDGDADFDDVYYLQTDVGYWGRVNNVTGDSIGRTQMGCGVLPPGDGAPPGGGRHAIAAHGGFGGKGNGRRLDRIDLLTLDNRNGWSWAPMRTSGRLPPPRMGHSLHVLNTTALVVFGGTTDYGTERPTGGAVNEVWLARPNRLMPAHLLPASGAGAGAALAGAAADESSSPPSPSSLPPPSLIEVEPVDGRAARPAAATAAGSAPEAFGDGEAVEEASDARQVELEAPQRPQVRELGVETKKKKAKAKRKKRKAEAHMGFNARDEL